MLTRRPANRVNGRFFTLATVAALVLPFVGAGPAAAGTGNDRPQRPKPLVKTLSDGAADHANPDAPGIAKKAAPGGEAEGGDAVDSPLITPQGAASAGPSPDLGINLFPWTEQGPGPTLGGQDEGLTAQQNPVTGAVSIAVSDPANAAIVYAATVSGGIWKTTNATASSPTWTPLTDHQASLAISDLAISPVSSSTLYASTGSFSSALIGEPGVGIYKSTDSGTTWTRVGADHFLNRRLSVVKPTTLNNGNVVLTAEYDAATGNDGVWRSTDAGTTWTRISGTGGLPQGGVNTVVGDPGNANRFYAVVRTGTSRGVYRSTDGGLNWTAVNSGLTGATSADRILLSVHNDASVNALYAAVLNGSTLSGVLRSTDQGAHWKAMDLPPSLFPGGQAFIHGALLADRTSATKVYIAGDQQPQAVVPNDVGAKDFSLRAFVGDASSAAGSQWSSITNNGANGTSPHADSRRLTFDASGNILAGTDGGVYRLTSPGSSSRAWASVIGNLRVSEFWSTAYDTSTNTLLGGAQDTGVPEQSASGSLTWKEYQKADGGVAAVDTTSVSGKSIRYTTRQFLAGFDRATYDSSGNFVSNTKLGLVVNGTSGTPLTTWDANVQFLNPYALNAVDPTRMLIGTANVYESTNRGDTLTDRTGNLGFFISALAYGGRAGGVNNADVAYVGTKAPDLRVRTANGGAFNKLANYVGATPVSIAMDPQNWHTVVVVDSDDHVWLSTNTGTSWSDISLNLPGLQPAPFAGHVTFLAGPTSATDDAIAVGGYGGIYGLRNPTSITSLSAWTRIGGGGLPNVFVQDVRYDPVDDVLIAGTFGRGAWTIARPELLMAKFLPQLSVSDPTVLEPTSGTTKATFTVKLSPAAKTAVSVSYTTTDGTATAASGDYVAVPTTTLTFPAGTTSLTVPVTVNADNRHEPTETFSLTLSSATNATIVDSAGTATILDNTGPFSVSVRDAQVNQPVSGDTVLNVPVSLSAAPAAGETVTVTVATADGSATVAGGDYDAVPPTALSFTNATGAVRNVPVTVHPGPTSEPTETFTLTVSSPSSNATVSDPKAVATIVATGGPPLPSVYVTDARVIEPPVTTAIAAFHVFLAAPANAPVSVQYRTVDGTATAGSDYTAIPLTTLTFAAGETDKEVDVTVGADTFHEPPQTFSLALSSPSGVVLGDPAGTATIADPRGVFTFAVSDATVVESVTNVQLARFTVTLSGTPANGETVTVKVATADGTATVANGDYTALPASTLTFTNASATTQTVLVSIASGPATESTETFTLNLSGQSANAALADKQGVGTIVN